MRAEVLRVCCRPVTALGVELSKQSVPRVGLVFLVSCWWTGHLRLCESRVRRKHPRQTENGNSPLVICSWPVGGSMGGVGRAGEEWQCLYLPGSIGSAPPPRQSVSPHQQKWSPRVMQSSAASSALATARRHGKEQLVFESLATWLVCRETRYFSCSISRMVLPHPFGGSSLGSPKKKKKSRLHWKACLRQSWTKPWASQEAADFIQ